ncbi:MAG: PaaI family thioesterase [Actinomycetota bacterium]|nr:PaaI family thioesterase [Actinomycetota bacterium]MDA2971025.1 PaaI family thioesterase [Actinomycetota bacterium]MDA3000809.1 PaaI family thioesterase [Actinomycetota bacterium]
MTDDAAQGSETTHPLSENSTQVNERGETIRRALLEIPENRDSLYQTASGKVRLAQGLRQMLQHSATSTTDDAVMARAADLIDEAVRLLEPGPHGRGYNGSAEGSVGGVPHGFTSHSPVTGPLNALASIVTLSSTDTEVIAEVTYGDAYEGPPGHVHGGLIAAIFDEVLGFAQALSGAPGMTGKLEITYRSPTPLHTPLRVVGRFERIDGRKIFTTGTIHAGDRLCAEAKGLFISVRPERFGALDQLRDEHQGRHRT